MTTNSEEAYYQHNNTLVLQYPNNMDNMDVERIPAMTSSTNHLYNGDSLPWSPITSTICAIIITIQWSLFDTNLKRQ
jgi:hypothetical protein